jgi:uncharacterized protein YjbJ (UPF0337 family)
MARRKLQVEANGMSFMDKAKNAAQKLMGEGKQAVGEHTDDPNMAAEGQKDQVACDLKQAGEKAKDAFKN